MPMKYTYVYRIYNVITSFNIGRVIPGETRYYSSGSALKSFALKMVTNDDTDTRTHFVTTTFYQHNNNNNNNNDNAKQLQISYREWDVFNIRRTFPRHRVKSVQHSGSN